MHVSKLYIESILESSIDSPKTGVIISQKILDAVKKNKQVIEKIVKKLDKKKGK